MLPLKGKVLLLDETEISQQALYLKAIHLDKVYAKAYFELSKTISVDGSITLLDGTEMTQVQLCLKGFQPDAGLL